MIPPSSYFANEKDSNKAICILMDFMHNEPNETDSVTIHDLKYFTCETTDAKSSTHIKQVFKFNGLNSKLYPLIDSTKTHILQSLLDSDRIIYNKYEFNVYKSVFPGEMDYSLKENQSKFKR